MNNHLGRIGAAIVVALVAAGMPGGVSQARSAIFNVTTTDATYDGVCDDHCSLWDAVYTANGLPGKHTVFVPTGVYTATSGPLTIWSDLTLQSVGGQVTLDAKGTGRVVKVNKEGNATFKGFLVTNGKVTDGGAGILNEGTLTLVDTVVNASTSTITCGGGLLNAGTAYLSGSSIAVNKAPRGAGICNGRNSTLTLTNTDVGFNQATEWGGGIYNTGRAEVRRSEVGSNLAAYGGGIFSDGILAVKDSLIAQNEATVDGGAIDNLDIAEITDSRIIDNAADAAGAIRNGAVGSLEVVGSTVQGNSAYFGGGFVNYGTLDVARSTLADNSAEIYSGGALYNYTRGTATIANSTLSGNTAGGDGGAVYQGSDNAVTITSSTIVYNVANDDTVNGGRGGGIFVTAAGATVKNSILAANQNPGAFGSVDCFGLLTSAGHNIIGDEPESCFATIPASDSRGVPQLGPLADNGGPTQTHALSGTRGAIDHGPRGAACTGSDQRGVPRVSPCDTGAYELVKCGTVPVNVVGTSSSDTLSGTGNADGILARGGADRVNAGAGNDRACGGSGNDVLLGGAGNDHLLAGAGRDRCSGGAGTDSYQSCESRS